MFNLDDITSKNNNKIFRLLIIGPSGSGKTNTLINLIQSQGNNLVQLQNNIIDKIYLNAADLEEPKYQYLIKKREDAGIKNLNDPSAFIEYSNNIDDIFDDINDYDPKRKKNVWIIFDDMISLVIKDKKAQHVLQDLFTRSRKLNISLVFISPSYFSVPKLVRFNCTHYLIIKIYNRKELQQIAIDNSADIDYKDFLKIYRHCTNEPYLFLTINATLSTDNPMRCRKNFSDPLL